MQLINDVFAFKYFSLCYKDANFLMAAATVQKENGRYGVPNTAWYIYIPVGCEISI